MSQIRKKTPSVTRGVSGPPWFLRAMLNILLHCTHLWNYYNIQQVCIDARVAVTVKKMHYIFWHRVLRPDYMENFSPG